MTWIELLTQAIQHHKEGRLTDGELAEKVVHVACRSDIQEAAAMSVLAEREARRTAKKPTHYCPTCELDYVVVPSSTASPICVKCCSRLVPKGVTYTQ